MAEITDSQAKPAKHKTSSAAVKALGLFSGVQMISILCSIIRTKFVSLWLGPAGFGLFGLFYNAFETIRTLTQLGIRESAVRDVAAISDSPEAVSRMAWIIKRWAWVLGVTGALLTIAFAPLLSRLTFGDSNQTTSFIILSAAVFFSSITNSRLVVLQGLRRLRRLAAASIWGAIGGLAISLPMYYFWRIDSIVPSLIAYWGVAFIMSWIWRERLPNPQPAPTRRETLRGGREFIRLGFYMTLSMILGNAINYLLLVYLNHNASTYETGLFQAGFTITTRYVGLVFSAIMMEFYPRMSLVTGSRLRTSTFINHEIMVCVMVITPLCLGLSAFDHVVVNILYDSDFQSMTPYLDWAMAGSALRAASSCMSIAILARGDGRTYMLLEIFASLTYFGLSIAAWNLGGLQAMGIAYMMLFIIDSSAVAIVLYKRYGLRLSRSIIVLLCVSTALAAMAAIMRNHNLQWPVIAMTVVAVIISMRRLRHLI